MADTSEKLTTRHIQRYGWKPSLPDPRDLIADASAITIAAEVDPRKKLPKPYDQGQLGSCTANAIAAAIQYDVTLSKAADVSTPSRLDIYYGERKIEGSIDSDAGAYGRDGFKYAHTVGVIPEADWPYDISKFKQAPPADVAHRHKIGAYKAVPRNQHSMMSVLSNRQTIAFGFSVFSSFESQEVATTGIMPVPQQGEQMIGGHEVLMVGYLKAHKQHVLCRNSWGTGWGMKGYFLMPWAIVLDANMSSDFRTIYRAAGQ